MNGPEDMLLGFAEALRVSGVPVTPDRGQAFCRAVSLAGLGALLATSATAFALLDWAGATCLVWLGVRLWGAPVEAGAVPPPSAPRA